jgi:hypothetical protein
LVFGGTYKKLLMYDEWNFRVWIAGIAVALVLVLGALFVLLRTSHTDVATSIPADPAITSSITNKSSLTPVIMTSPRRGQQ